MIYLLSSRHPTEWRVPAENYRRHKLPADIFISIFPHHEETVFQFRESVAVRRGHNYKGNFHHGQQLIPAGSESPSDSLNYCRIRHTTAS
jgi:hypothetical protein